METLDPIDGGCRYTITQELDIRSGDVALRSWVTQVRAHHRDRLDRTREVLASASSVPDVPPTAIAGAPWPPPTPTRWEPPNVSVAAAPDEGSQQSSRVVTLQESVLLPWSCDHVWEVMTSPEMVPVLDVGFVRTYRIPGTPEGVGEWWAHEIASGATVIYETLEYDRPRRLVVQPVLPIPDSRTVTTLAPAAGGCAYTVSIDKHRDTSSHEDVASDERWRQATRARIAALQRALATPDAGAEQRSAERADVSPPAGRPRLRLDRRLTERDALVLCVLAVAVTVLVWFRNFVLAGLAVLLVVLALLVGPRLARRLRRPRTVTIQESIRLPWSCDEVWALIEPVENEPLLDPTFRVCLHVPGTPRGVGERQAAVTTAGVVVVSEIVEIVPGRRLAAELVSPQVLGRQHVVQTLEPVDGGCVYTVTVEAGVTKRTMPASHLRESLRRRLERTRQVLESSTA